MGLFDNLLTSDVIPSGVDWADGLDGRPGTETPPDVVSTIPDDSIFEELSNSPEIERAEQGTIQHSFRMDWLTGKIYLQALGRGTFLLDSVDNLTKIVSSRLTRQKGNTASLTVTAESLSFDNPPDEFDLSVTELNPSLEKDPRYAFLPADVRALVNQTVSGAQLVSQQEALSRINTIADNDPDINPPPAGATWAVVQQAANELLSKRRIGEDTFYLPGFTVVWAQYFWLPQSINPGGYIEDPIYEGGLPLYFWSTTGTHDGPTIFDRCIDFNPQFYQTPPGALSPISWLRLSDHIQYVRTWFKITHTWLGAPYAHWDADIYSNKPSPYPPPPTRTISQQ